MARHLWTPEEEQTIRTMWMEGASAQTIAAVLGHTKNMVAGKANRMGLGNQMALDTESGKLLPRSQIRSDRRDPNVTKEKVQKARDKAADKAAKQRRERAMLAEERALQARRERAEELRDGAYKTGLVLDMPVPEGFIGVTMDDLLPEHCRYPVGTGADLLYCGQKRNNPLLPYCAECQTICYTEQDE